MDSNNNLPKSVTESSLFSTNRDTVCKDVSSYDEIAFGVTFAIACKPEEFPFANEEKGIRVAKTDGNENIPALTIYFKEFNDEIILLDIEITKE